MAQRWMIGPEHAGRRLDATLAARLPCSRVQARHMLEAGEVKLNGRTVDARAKGRALEAGDRIELAHSQPPAQRLPIANPDMPLNIVEAGDDWLIVNKPAGRGVHPLRPEQRDTVLNAIIARYPHVAGLGEGGLRSGIVHRLDVQTSGTLALALSQDRWDQLRHAFEHGPITKQYRALVHGQLAPDNAWQPLSMHLYIAQHRPARVRVCDKPQTSQPNVRACHLRWRCLEAWPHASYVEVELGTGFLHQIRVMLAAIGHPVLGDPIYGHAGPTPAPRCMLHARHLRIGPVQGQCDEPADFQTMLTHLRRTDRDPRNTQ